ncbi:probable cytochrome P450 CYP44 isoform X2 [Physella acuta]|nr:probable cytochrome P450 CYP44 isoform X2 [Physella acuta]XP_059167588.1 probable cytochrome P450 CYP44 isoform X2 [Physella acuta]
MLIIGSHRNIAKAWSHSYAFSIFVRRKSSSINLNENATQVEYNNAHPFSSIPGPGGLPWFGQWLKYKLNPKKVHRRDLVLKEFYEKYGDIVKETVAGRTIVHLFNPDYIKQIYETEGKYPLVPPLLESVEFYRRKKELAPGLGNSNGEQWYRLRSIVQHIMLRPLKSLDYLPAQNKVANDFINKLPSLIENNGEVSNFNRWIARWGLESAANNCLDKRMGYMDESGMAAGDKIIDTNHSVFELSIKLYFAIPFYKLFFTPSLKELFECEDFINDEALRLTNIAIEEYKEAFENGTLTEDRFRFLSYMLSNPEMTKKDLMPVVLSVLTDTLSTTSQILLCNLYNLACNPNVQEKVYEETKKILQNGDLTSDGFSSATYIKACIKESFRLFPVGLDILRLCPSNMVIGGYQVPERTYLCLNNYIQSLDPDVIPEPQKFIPDRWLREEYSEKLHPYLLTPFSLGRRMCAGRRFAEQELVIMIAKILSRYRLEWHYGEVHQRYRLLLIPDQEIKIKFVPR